MIHQCIGIIGVTRGFVSPCFGVPLAPCNSAPFLYVVPHPLGMESEFVSVSLTSRDPVFKSLHKPGGRGGVGGGANTCIKTWVVKWDHQSDKQRFWMFSKISFTLSSPSLRLGQGHFSGWRVAAPTGTSDQIWNEKNTPFSLHEWEVFLRMWVHPVCLVARCHGKLLQGAPGIHLCIVAGFERTWGVMASCISCILHRKHASIFTHCPIPLAARESCLHAQSPLDRVEAGVHLPSKNCERWWRNSNTNSSVGKTISWQVVLILVVPNSAWTILFFGTASTDIIFLGVSNLKWKGPPPRCLLAFGEPERGNRILFMLHEVASRQLVGVSGTTPQERTRHLGVSHG